MRRLLIILGLLPAPPALAADDYCRDLWTAAYSIAWSHQRDDIGRMFWEVVALGPGLGDNDADKVRLALQPVTAEDIVRLADAAFAVPRAAGPEEQARLVKDFADAARGDCEASAD